MTLITRSFPEVLAANTPLSRHHYQSSSKNAARPRSFELSHGLSRDEPASSSSSFSNWSLSKKMNTATYSSFDRQIGDAAEQVYAANPSRLGRSLRALFERPERLTESEINAGSVDAPAALMVKVQPPPVAQVK